MREFLEVKQNDGDDDDDDDDDNDNNDDTVDHALHLQLCLSTNPVYLKHSIMSRSQPFSFFVKSARLSSNQTAKNILLVKVLGYLQTILLKRYLLSKCSAIFKPDC